MALQSSGKITLKDIQGEFGGTAPHTLKEYYAAASGIPSSGTISIKDFYGATDQIFFTVSSNQQEMNLSTYLTAQGWNGTDAVHVTINSGVYIWSDNTSVGGLTIPSSMNNLVEIVNNGYIIGRGGNGGSNGGPALVNNATGVTLTNASGAYIAGGGGGGGGYYGGGGAGGGYGAPFSGAYAGGSGGSVGNSGGNGNLGTEGGDNGKGGGAGGGGGTVGGAGGGGRILPGTGGNGGVSTVYGSTGGAGGSAGNAGSSGGGTYGGGGGGGWGAAGGQSGGAGGAAISGTTIATYTNNGTVYGTVA